MRILITGCCGFTGFHLLQHLRASPPSDAPPLDLLGIDNLSRGGSEGHRRALAAAGIPFVHGDLRMASDVDALPPVDWVIDAAAAASVLAGVQGQTSSRQLVEHNLQGTVNLLEYCRRHQAGLLLLSTSRVYSIDSLRQIPLTLDDDGFQWTGDAPPRGQNSPPAVPAGLSRLGVTEAFSTDPPLSLYGATKRASELLALEYHHAFGLPVWINRCGLLAGEGQFGRPDQGIIAYWLHSWLAGRPLKFIGFNGRGAQVRDCLHPHDLARLLVAQMTTSPQTPHRIFNVSGGSANRFSLWQLSQWCQARFGARSIASDSAPRAFDVPWLVLDHTRASEIWQWSPRIDREEIFRRIAEFAEAHPDWLELSSG